MDCTTAQQPGSVVAPTEKKRIGLVTSAERGELIIVLYQCFSNCVPRHTRDF